MAFDGFNDRSYQQAYFNSERNLADHLRSRPLNYSKSPFNMGGYDANGHDRFRVPDSDSDSEDDEVMSTHSDLDHQNSACPHSSASQVRVSVKEEQQYHPSAACPANGYDESKGHDREEDQGSVSSESSLDSLAPDAADEIREVRDEVRALDDAHKNNILQDIELAEKAIENYLRNHSAEELAQENLATVFKDYLKAPNAQNPNQSCDI